MFKIVTHSQQFHIDDVMAVALLETYFFKGEKYELVRTRNQHDLDMAKNDSDVFVIDVGYAFNPNKRNFDHHQNNPLLCWEDSVPFSSCGMIWSWLRSEGHLNTQMSQETMDTIERNIIRRVDKHDNGMAVWLEGIFFIMYNRKPDDPRAQDGQFKRSVRAARDYLVNAVAFAETGRSFTLDLDRVTANVLLDVYAGQGTVFDETVMVVESATRSKTMTAWKWLRETKKLHQNMNKETMDILEKEYVEKMEAFIIDGVDEEKYGFLTAYKAVENAEKRVFRIAKDYYINFFTYVRGNMQAEKEILKAIKKSAHLVDVVVCDSNIKDSTERVGILTDKKMVIYPHSNGCWAIKSVPADKKNAFSIKFPAPQHWRGLTEGDLEKASGIKGMFFCHKAGFVTMFKGSIDEAIKVAHTIIEG